MKISTKGRYGLRVMIDLATYGESRHIPLREISQRQNITIKYLEQIMTPLLKGGYVNSFRGNNGGYQLKRPATEITVGEIIRTMEGSLAPVACLEGEENVCPNKHKCQTLPVWEKLDALIEDYLNNIILQDLVQDRRDVHETCPLTNGRRC
ncbi:MAG: Rrf2 family transcriptional regulator [Peptococcaceae bacterium]|nr:Rrf2 family transcriptional regulator [Peptococcaceae bacterium]